MPEVFTGMCFYLFFGYHPQADWNKPVQGEVHFTAPSTLSTNYMPNFLLSCVVLCPSMEKPLLWFKSELSGGKSLGVRVILASDPVPCFLDKLALEFCPTLLLMSLLL